jgi:hypothetical protein
LLGGSELTREFNLDGVQERSRLAGAFQRYQEAVSQQRVANLLQGYTSFSRKGELSAWVVIWLIIFQRLHPKGTLAVAVRELLTGPIQAWVGEPKGKPRGPLSPNTSAYSQARSRLPLEVVEQVSDLIFESLSRQPKVLPGLDQPMFLLDGSALLLSHSKALAAAYPPGRNQHGLSHWPVLRVVVAHDVLSGLATRPAWGPMYGDQAVGELWGDGRSQLWGLLDGLPRHLPPTPLCVSSHASAGWKTERGCGSACKNRRQDSLGSQPGGPAQQPGDSRRCLRPRPLAGV